MDAPKAILYISFGEHFGTTQSVGDLIQGWSLVVLQDDSIIEVMRI